ncbi:S-norcoclaurine synthase 1 [Dichanthelium oligosanthes]|uniref:S-norcoclaurine synthase 1 n=1 Tax=Dichanthelium oligosanthes TaxID=888268 RepID=A0A1E5UPX4_9POAL|nr:S-norcoclaurine synthase 1 [Dichanthelium oligosanthes]
MAHANAGGHLQVPNVQALAQTWNGSSEQVPARYVRTEEAGAEVVVAGHALPVVDLGRLLDPRSSEEELANLGSSCQQGFFQLVNHGVPDEVMLDVKRDIAEFFKLPLETKKVHEKPPDGLEGYGQVFVFSETQKLDWSDMLYIMLRPVESRDMRFWPVQPPSFRSSVDRYSAEAAKVVSCLLRFMAVDMGVEPERLLEMFGGQPQTMKMTYYPPCRQAGDVLGLSPHTDACAMTLLLHVNDVQGLQIRRDDGKWLAVEPLDGALIILSNGKYRSVEHRAVVHPDKERISAAMFHQPVHSIMVEPLPELVTKDAGGARYKSVGYAEFMRHFFSAKLDGRKSHLDQFKIY